MQKADVRKKRTLFPVLGAQRPVCISPINDKTKQALRLNGKIIIELFFREIYLVNLLICFKYVLRLVTLSSLGAFTSRHVFVNRFKSLAWSKTNKK